MAFVVVDEEVHTKLNLLKAKHKLKSHNEVIKELLFLWESLP